jgi:hypothetical protein
MILKAAPVKNDLGDPGIEGALGNKFAHRLGLLGFTLVCLPVAAQIFIER